MLERISSISLENIFAVNLASGFEPLYVPKIYPSERGDRYMVKIWDTHHFRMLEGSISPQDYGEYIEILPQPEHGEEIFRALQAGFDETILARNPIRLEEIELGSGQYRVLDGVHRLAILFWRDSLKTIPREFVDGISDYDLVSFSESQIRRIKRKLKRFDDSKLSNGWHVRRGLGYGYHSFHMGNLQIKGQRNPVERLRRINLCLDLSGRNILDLGCSSGGMLLHQHNIGRGVGWDWDSKAISVAFEIKAGLSECSPEFASRFSFHKRDLDSPIQTDLVATVMDNNIDTIFLLSMGSWLSNWQRVSNQVARLRLPVVLETNNDTEGAEQLDLFRRAGFELTVCSEDSKDDATGNFARRTFIASPL